MLCRPLVALAALAHGAAAIRPKFSWDTLGNMTFIHTCNESGLFADAALDTITKFPFVTVEKGQGFNDGTGRYAEEKIAERKAEKRCCASCEGSAPKHAARRGEMSASGAFFAAKQWQ